MRKLKLMVAALVLTLGAGAAPNFPSGTFIVSGMARNGMNAAYGSGGNDETVVVQAVAEKDGTILAEARVVEPRNGRNYALQIPVSTLSSDKTACKGDRLCIWATVGTMRYLAASNLTVSAAHQHLAVDLKALETKSFASKHAGDYGDGSNVLVPQAYLDELLPWMEAYEKPTYAPDDDWDEDGRDNFSEYLAGTNPFDASDFLGITAFRAVPASSGAAFSVNGSVMSISFESVGGHTYTIQATPELAHPKWAAKGFSTEADGEKSQTKYTASGTESDGDIVTLYMLPTVESNAEFLTVKPE